MSDIRGFKNMLMVGLIVFALAACSVFGGVNVDIAPYKVLQKDGRFEIRHYDQLVLAQTNGPKRDGGLSYTFRRLFSYISGNNNHSKEIAMTAPVLMDTEGKIIKSMAFVLPTSISFDTAPLPKDPSVKIIEVRDYTVISIKFSGFLNENNIAERKKELRVWATQRALKINGPARIAGYNPPFTLPFMRRNEVLIPIIEPE
ncbi:MAG: hypothetical protein CBB68_13405 [Rhodospirillaceae bacterium TMED8]|nr:heme-binding protein [Magnetovibrio sp.]OUT48558.1 MAG: hypothetical protein CBB68_13405 [Rhodospirillaceae bacterium TMED8]|tara:strand:- start:3440 stop:4042 length:603 start_codon:yes stop_codon:yes gene_type:complete